MTSRAGLLPVIPTFVSKKYFKSLTLGVCDTHNAGFETIYILLGTMTHFNCSSNILRLLDQSK